MGEGSPDLDDDGAGSGRAGSQSVGRNRHLPKDFETLIDTDHALLELAAIRILTRRLAVTA